MRLKINLIVFVLVSLSGLHIVSGQSTPENKANIQLTLDAAYGQGDVAAIERLFAESYVRFPGETNRQQVIQNVLALRAAMPDLTITFDVLLAEENRVAARYRLGGNFVNELLFPDSVPIPPTGQPFQMTIHSIFTLDEAGLVIREDNGFDNLGFLVLIGALPPPEVTGTTSPALLPVNAGEVPAANRDFVNTFFTAYGSGDFSTVTPNVNEGYVSTNMFGAFDYDAQVNDINMLRQSFPNLVVTVDQTVAEGNWIGAQYTLSGTFLNDYVLPNDVTVEATVGFVEVPIVVFFGFDDAGGLTQTWEIYDSWDFLSKLGLTLPAVPGATEGE